MNGINKILSQFICKNLIQVTDKIIRFKTDGITGNKLLFDFDRTLTYSLNQDTDVTTWNLMKSYLPKAGIREYDDLFQKYRSLELKGTMTKADAIAWWEQSLNLYIKFRVNFTQASLSFLAHALIRPQTKELFNYCRSYSIPTVIISAGIKDMIELWLEKYEIQPDLILATKLLFDQKGYITGWDPRTLIHILNKNTQSQKIIKDICGNKPNTILVGDGIDDASMTHGDNHVIRIRIFDPRVDEKIDKNSFYEKTFSRFDLILENQSLQPILDLVKSIVQNAP